jgi:hypothetical protein
VEKQMKKNQLMFYKLSSDNKKVFYADGKLIGNEFAMKRHLVNEKGMAFSKATKVIAKIKLWNEDKTSETATIS